MKKWLPILALGFTQFDKVFDGTVMNASIAEVVGDLGITNGMGNAPNWKAAPLLLQEPALEKMKR